MNVSLQQDYDLKNVQCRQFSNKPKKDVSLCFPVVYNANVLKMSSYFVVVVLQMRD